VPRLLLAEDFYSSTILAAGLLVGIGRQRCNLILTKKKLPIFFRRFRGKKSMAVLIWSLGRYGPGTISCAALFLMKET
jgi:hypothetical protein